MTCSNRKPIAASAPIGVGLDALVPDEVAPRRAEIAGLRRRQAHASSDESSRGR